MALPKQERERLDAANDALGIGADLEQLRQLEPPPQSSERRQQIARRALDQAALHAASSGPAAMHSPLHRRAPVFALAALAAAVMLAVWFDAQRTPSSAPQASTQRVALALRLDSGQIEVGGAPLGNGASITARTLARTLDEPAELAFTDASILHADARTTLVYAGDFNGQERVELRQGRVSLQVQPRAHQPLVIETEELSAHVIGTRFDVTRQEQGPHVGTTVRVREGRVRVVAKHDGAVHILAAGEELTVPATEPGSVAGNVTSTTISPSDEPASLALEPTENAASDRNQARAEARTVSTEIRRKLRRGEVDAARSLLRRAERERAVGSLELALLQAEADLAEHRHERAKSRYLAIVAEHPGSPEAELSLFAAAQLSHGPTGIDLLQRYLARYPNGRFAKEAQRLLQALDQP